MARVELQGANAACGCAVSRHIDDGLQPRTLGDRVGVVWALE